VTAFCLAYEGFHQDFILFYFISVLFSSAVYELPKYRAEHGAFHSFATATASSTTATATTSNQPGILLMSFL